MRPSTRAALFFGLAGVAFAFTFFDARQGEARERVAANAARVAELGLTDLCLFTEARYTRHLSQADYHSAFQDHPLAFEHFPSGALVAPPPVLSGSAP
jgi:hypothetical protein